MQAPLRLGRATVAFEGLYTITTLPDGQRIIAAPQDNDAYRATAKRLGYGTDTQRMCREHEASHSAICAWLQLPESPTMRAVAGDEGPTDLSNAEEDAVCALARFANMASADLLDAFARHPWGMSTMSGTGGSGCAGVHLHVHSPDIEQAMQLLRRIETVLEEQVMVKFADIEQRIDQVVAQADRIGNVADSAVSAIAGLRQTFSEIQSQLQNALDNGDDNMIQAQLDRLGSVADVLGAKEQELAIAIAGPQQPVPEPQPEPTPVPDPAAPAEPVPGEQAPAEPATGEPAPESAPTPTPVPMPDQPTPLDGQPPQA